ncbi:MAG: hypothetical protein EPO51_13310 [Phenylobacterium sp.]|nr:MAG: hypothetical protein EPO51_13310 [Phenylobacterium sp.]
MSFQPTSLERAFELARSGECASISDVRKRLKQEGLSVSQLEGPMLTRQLREICTAATLSSAANAVD